MRRIANRKMVAGSERMMLRAWAIFSTGRFVVALLALRDVGSALLTRPVPYARWCGRWPGQRATYPDLMVTRTIDAGFRVDQSHLSANEESKSEKPKGEPTPVH
jgi:hypothetical protein